MIKVLEISAALDGGGVDHLLYELCSRIKDIHFDFVVTAETKGVLEDDLINRGCKIYHIHQMSGNFNGYIGCLRKIIKEGKYDIVHDHMNQASMGSMIAAYMEKTTVRIAHCHTWIKNESIYNKTKRRIMALIAKMFSTHLCGCSINSARWMWGNRTYDNGLVYIMRNAIDTKKFAFSNELRQKLRMEYEVENNLVICNVSRFSKEKNHKYIIDVTRRLKEKGINVSLFLIGNGQLEEEIKAYVKDKEMNEYVHFLGIRTDVYRLLNMMDIFLLPSEYEGFPVTIVEAQANCLPSIVSDNISKECKLSDIVYFLPVDEDVDNWAGAVVEHLRDYRKMDEQILIYDVEQEATRLKNYYLSSLKGNIQTHEQR